jgi:hypothetical protein
MAGISFTGIQLSAGAFPFKNIRSLFEKVLDNVLKRLYLKGQEKITKDLKKYVQTSPCICRVFFTAPRVND